MIKGNIEVISDDHVSGWIYVQGQEMRGQTILAFLDEECIGAGKISIFRQDLADAGLGDGVLGFDIPVRVPAAADRPRVTVRLDGSDAILLQHGVKVGGSPAQSAKPAFECPGRSLPAASLQWMLARGWLQQADYDFLKFFGRMGVYDRTLRLPRSHGEAADPGWQDPALVARDLLGLWAMRDVEVLKRQVRPQDDLAGTIKMHIEKADILPIYALWGADRGKIAVAEGSHVRNGDEAVSADILFIDYPLGPDRLLVLEGNISIRKLEGLPQAGVILYAARIVN